MAGGGYACQFCDGEHGVSWILTNLENGATFSVCNEDFAPAMINVVAVDLGVDPTKFYESVLRFVARQATAAAKEAEKATTEDDGAAGESSDGDGHSTENDGHGDLEGDHLEGAGTAAGTADST